MQLPRTTGAASSRRVVVPRPGSDQVSSLPGPSAALAPVAELDGVVLVDRPGAAERGDADRLQVTGSGSSDDLTVASLLCGVSGCGWAGTGRGT